MTEISVHLRTTTFDDAFADLRDAIKRYVHRQRDECMPDRVCVPCDQARELKRLPASKISPSSAWEYLTTWVGGLQMELVELPPVHVVATFTIEVLSDGTRRIVA